MLNLSRFVVIIKVISKSRASVKDNTEWLVRCHITSVLGCTTYAVPAEIVLVVIFITFAFGNALVWF